MSAPRGTTPTLTLTFTDQGLDLTAANQEKERRSEHA